ncbi:MAG: extracellular solute-binding protein [Clostridiales bacterium]|jgi:putative aldouronate transport system substrate-binding protein|nr:extracellular solute-binding protein [Clostridiales bacterium]
MKKSFIQFLVAIAMAALLAACGASSEPPAAAPAASPGQAADASAEAVTLKVLTMRWGDMGDSFKQNQWLQDAEKKAGVKIEWDARSDADWNEQRALLIGSGTGLPDVFLGNETIKDGDIISNMDLFLPLDDLIANYMPNYKKAIEAIPAFKDLTVFPDGTIRSFAKNLPCRPMTRNQPIINQKWLDNLGLQNPTTLDELKAVLIAFKEGDANGNGDPGDEIPFSFNADVPVDLMNPFGITDINSSRMSWINGEFVHYPTSENYKSAIKWIRELWEAGVLDQEGFTQDWAMLNNKWQNAEINIVGLNFQWSVDAVTGQWKDEFAGIAPIKGPDGKQYAEGDWNGVYTIARNEAVITRDCKNPEAAARWLDLFYDSEASIQNFWGAIGTVITKNSDGTYSLNNPPEGTSADAWYWDQSLRDFGPKFIEPGFSEKILLDRTTGDGAKLELSKLADEFIVDQYPLVIFTEEENNELASIGADLDSYVSQSRIKWITEGGIDQDWNAYIQQLKDMGLDRFVEIKMAALERARG